MTHRSQFFISRQMRHDGANHPPRWGFTLVEMLLVIAIVGILSTIVVAGVRIGRDNAYTAREVSSAKSLVTAYLMTPFDNDGNFMPGLNPGAASVSGSRWSGAIKNYLGGLYQQTLYVNEQMSAYNKLRYDEYRLTLYCSFGMNLDYVGGTLSPNSSFASNAVMRTTDALDPAGLIAFASANSRSDGEDYGYFIIRSPFNGSWPPREATSNPANALAADNYGKVAFRHNDKAVVAFLDGHVELLDSKKMRDMRLWSNDARYHNDPNYSPPPLE